MAAPKGNRFALRRGTGKASTKKHLVSVTDEEHARHHELADALGKTLAELVRELLAAKADQVLGLQRSSKRPPKKPRAG
jgi:hypothetical protein